MRELTAEDISEVMDTVSRPAVISKKIYADVELVLEESPGISRQEAFRRYAAQSGRKLGAVSANYYREAKKQRKGSSLAAPAPGAATPRRALGGGEAEASEMDQLARRLVETVQRIAELLDEQQREIVVERERIEKAKRAIIDA